MNNYCSYWWLIKVNVFSMYSRYCDLSLLLLPELPHMSSHIFCSKNVNLLLVFSDLHAFIQCHDFVNAVLSVRNIFYPHLLNYPSILLSVQTSLPLERLSKCPFKKLASLLCAYIYLINSHFPQDIVGLLSRNITSDLSILIYPL